MRTTEMNQTMGVRPRANIHKAVNPTSRLLTQRAGCQTRSKRNASANIETRNNLSDLLTADGICRKGPRRIPSNNNAVNHITGEFRNQGRGGCATASPTVGAQRRIRMNCSSTPHELGLYFRPFRGHSAVSPGKMLPLAPPRLYCCGDG